MEIWSDLDILFCSPVFLTYLSWSVGVDLCVNCSYSVYLAKYFLLCISCDQEDVVEIQH